MPKIKIRVSICNSQNKNEYETNGIIQDDILKYKEPNKTTEYTGIFFSSLVNICFISIIV